MQLAIDQNDPYLKFLESKAVIAQERGYAGELNLNPNLKPHAKDVAAWMIRGGNRAAFLSFGLHKGSIQLQVCASILDQHPGSALITCPLGVRREFIKEFKARDFKNQRYAPVYISNDTDHEKALSAGHRLFLTNYERVRDGGLDPNRFQVASLDEAAVLRSFGSKTYQTFLPLFDHVAYKFVATATPSPNRFKEILHYAAFLGIMDSGQALTRWFKRDSTQAGNLTLKDAPAKQREFWLWCSTWACFMQRPSDLGHSDAGYELPDIKVIRHRLPVDHSSAGFDSWGQGKLIRNAATGLSDAAREKRDSLGARIERCRQIIDAAEPGRHWIIWHDLEDERRAIQHAIPEAECIWGSMDLIDREGIVERFADGDIRILGTKPSLSGSGSNFQENCYSNIFLGIGHKFHDFIQALHRTQRFGQTHEVEAHLIHTESEDMIYDSLMDKWRNHDDLHGRMAEIIREFGLSNVKQGAEMRRSIATYRHEVKGDTFTAVNSDNVFETRRLPDNSVKLIVTSPAFSDQYEYVESLNDFGHNHGDEDFFKQMEFLTPELYRVLEPGRMCCFHVKDRIVFGTVSGLGMYSVNRFSDKVADHLERHGFIFCGRTTVITDVVRENGQTYRLGWSENEKDGTKMGCGSSEYILLFRKLPSDLANSYADSPVRHPKPLCESLDGPVSFFEGGRIIPGTGYSRANWQFDAHGTWRSNGNRFMRPEEISCTPMDVLRRMWRKYSADKIYDFREHVSVAEAMEQRNILPSGFMALDVVNPGAVDVWDDITRMKTLNSNQARKGWEFHTCPLQIDIVERLIDRYSNPGDLVYDPYGGLGTTARQAVLMGRKGYTCELSGSYHQDAVSYLAAAEIKVTSPTLFDFLDAEAEEQNEAGAMLKTASIAE